MSFLSNLQDEKLYEKIKFWIKRQTSDPITRMLLPNSNLTETQLKTLLLDFLSEGFSEDVLTYQEKARLRSSKNKIINGKRRKVSAPTGVSRGAFNRVLKQARMNIIKSIYTVILLGYLGLFEDPRLQQYITLAEEIKKYAEMYEGVWENFLKKELSKEELKLLNEIQKNLMKMIKKLAEPLSLKKVNEEI